MKRIALQGEDDLIVAVVEYANRHGLDWTFPLVCDMGTVITKDELNKYQIDAAMGFSMEIDTLPYVNMGANKLDKFLYSVINDNIAIGELAAEHLLSLGLKHFHFVTYFSRPNEKVRFTGFSERLSKSGLSCSYNLIESEEKHLFIKGLSVDPFSYFPFLKDLTEPCGVMCINDKCAYALITACQMLNISVPNELCVIGVNNRLPYTKLSRPELTSIEIDLQQRGFSAAELLHKLIQGEKTAQKIQYIKPAGIIQRGSTYRLAVECSEVAEALNFIASHTAEGINVTDVSNRCHLSRRSLELKFKEHLDYTIFDAIANQRLRLVKELLKTTKLKLSEVALKSGYPNTNRMQTAIKSDTKMTAKQFRILG